jgi:DNA polymerase-3 subunit gamma/tau
VNYQNTLEHLNILDADYYFNLIECMQQQDLAGAMLLYDDINRKGFEGDMVMNGFSEFIRNLLVSKDEGSAALLEAVEGFREKYISTATKISSAYLVSALNILNEAEINYKAARNKRLHVELALIKLCYLQQAIELAKDANGVTKKKIAETSKPVAFRNIEPVELIRKSEIRTQKSEAKLIIENSIDKENILKEEQPTANNQQPVASNQQPVTHNQQPATRLAALEKIRSQIRGSGNFENGSGTAGKPLQLEELRQAWNDYIELLKAQKNSAWQGFEMAELQVQDNNNFIALVSSNIDLRFIEQEGLRVSQYLREKLQNNQLQFLIVMQENKEPKVTETPLTVREQYQKMIEQYPLVKELKERLRLELDY